jgi:hypothetical protein
MLFLKSTPLVRVPCFILILLSSQKGFSQINSPYSRYGLGDLYNSRNVANKGMGGLSAPTIDIQSVNFINPASYSRLQTVSFDVGIEYESRTLRDNIQSDRYKSANMVFNYVALGLPLKKNKLGQTVWGMAFGLRPYTRMNYKIEERGRLAGIDSISTLYEGSGGANKAFIGTGFKIKGLSLGFNMGYIFGQQEVSSERSIINDSVAYFPARYDSKTSYNKFFADAGLQYEIKLNKKSVIRLGFTGFLGQNLQGSQDKVQQTIAYNSSGGFDSIDVVNRSTGVRGVIRLPKGFTAGIAYDKIGRLTIGAEYEMVNWSDYRFYGQTDQTANSSMLRVGAQLTPPLTAKGYFGRVIYRAGFNTGKDYIVASGKKLPLWSGSLGFGLPIRRWNTYSNQYTVINTALEFGGRGNNDQPLKESFFKINVGLCLSDLWFFKKKFD